MRLPHHGNQSAPLLWAALCFAAGVLFARYAWRPPLWWLLALLACAAAAVMLLPRRPLLGWALALLGLAAGGALTFSGRAAADHPPDPAAFDDQRVLVSATVVRDSALHLPGSTGERQSFDVRTESLSFIDAQGAAQQPSAVATGLRVSVYSRDSFDEADADSADAPALFHYGQRLRFPARIHQPHNFGNPGAFDYRGYLADRGIQALASVRRDQIEVLAGDGGTWAGRLRSRIRASILGHVATLWPAEDAALLDAMLVSERSLVAGDARLAFQRSGVYHLLVVAGLHLGILAYFIYWLARRLRASEVVATLITLAGAAGYAWLADDGTPIWRATLMLAVYMAARLLYRERNALNAVGAAALALLVLDPRALFGASFQLSFVAVLAIVAIAMPLLERTSAPYRRALSNLDALALDLALPPRLAQFRLDVRLIAQRVAHFVPVKLAQRVGSSSPRLLASRVVCGAMHGALRALEIVVVSAVMQCGLALPMAWYFHRAVTLGLPANVLAVPLAGLLLPAAVIALAASYVWMTAARIPAWIAGLLLHAIANATRWFAAIRAADVRLATPSSMLIACAVVGFIFAAFALRRSRALAATGMVTFLVAALWIGFAPARPVLHSGVLEVTAIDVGQGDSLFVVAPDGHTLLIDAGGAMGPATSDFDYGEEVVSPYLWSRGITRLDAVELTHAHQDHIGGLRSVLRNFRPRELWLGRNPDFPALRVVLRQAQLEGTRVVARREGERFDFGGAQVAVLAPAADWQPTERPRNNDSVAIKVSLGSTAVLLPGDAERSLERRLAADEDVAADLLKVAHHGSATSTTPEFLAATHPRYALISAGARNPFGHPRPDVLARLGAAHVATFRTDTLGAVTFYLDGRQVRATLPNLP